MRREIKTETFVHPNGQEITRKYVYTFNEKDEQINKEFCVDPPEALSEEDIKAIKNLLTKQ